MSYAHHKRDTMRQALAALAAGGGVREVARALGLPIATVSYWKNNHLAAFQAGGLVFDEPAACAPAQAQAPADAPADDEEEEAPVLTSRDFGSACKWEIDALRCAAGRRCEPRSWEGFGFCHYVSPYIGPEQSARIFGGVARGVPIAAACAILPYRFDVIAQNESFERWRAALKICRQWTIEQLTTRVVAGLAGWRAAATRLALLDPIHFGETEEARALAARRNADECTF